MDVSFILFCGIFLNVTSKGQANTFLEHKRLHKHLEENLDNKVRPVINQSKPVVVGIDVHLQAIQGLDEKEQILRSTIALTCHWKYESLVWNESEYSGITTINILPEDAWIPDIIVSNAIDSLFILTENRADMMQINVESNGDATWYTGGNIRTSCLVDITKYPFDVQMCTITITKATLDSGVLIIPSGNEVLRILYKDNGEWRLEKSVIEKRLIYGYTTFVDVNLTLKRHSLFYVLNVIIPVHLLSFMVVFCIKIPVTSGERISYSISLLLTFVVLLNVASESMPRVPNHVSYLQIYIIYQLTVAVLVTMLSILLVKASDVDDEEQTSSIIKFYELCCNIKHTKKCVKSKSVRVIGINENEQKVDIQPEKSLYTQSPSKLKPGSKMWKQSVIRHIDEFLFMFFMSLFFVLTFLFSLLVSI